MTSNQLFFKRLKEEWVFQFKVVSMVVDWTIFLYLFVPAVGLGGYFYSTWWSQVPVWIMDVPLVFFLGLYYIFCWFGKIRTFLVEADQLFLVQKDSMILMLKKNAYVYSLVLHSLNIVILSLVLMPLLLFHYQLTYFFIISLTLFFIGLKILVLSIKRRNAEITNRWIKRITELSIFIVLGWVTTILLNYSLLVLAGLVGFGLAIGGWLLVKNNLSTKQGFFLDVLIDRNEKLKYVQWIVMAAPELENQSRLTGNRKRPLLIRHSRRIFRKRTRKNGLIEGFMKVFIRNTNYLFSYLRILSITLAGILLFPPLWGKWGLVVVGIFFLRYWLGLIWGTYSEKSFTILTGYRDDIYEAKIKAINLLWIPGTLLLFTVTLVYTIGS